MCVLYTVFLYISILNMSVIHTILFYFFSSFFPLYSEILITIINDRRWWLTQIDELLLGIVSISAWMYVVDSLLDFDLNYIPFVVCLCVCIKYLFEPLFLFNIFHDNLHIKWEIKIPNNTKNKTKTEKKPEVIIKQLKVSECYYR